MLICPTLSHKYLTFVNTPTKN